MPKLLIDFFWTLLAFIISLIITLNIMLAEIPMELE
mgnify:CR=1 FL=1